MMLTSRLTRTCALLFAATFFCASPELATAQKTIKLAHDQPETSTHHQAAQRFAQIVEDRSDGTFAVEIFPSSQLGSGTQMVEQLQAGAIEAAVLPTAWIAPMAPSVQVLDLPFLFPDRETTHQVVDGEVGAAILDPLQDVGILGLAFWESGFKQFTGNFSIQNPADYEGKKIRTMPAEAIQEQFRAFGATPTTIAFAELYSALQQEVVDGQENPIVTIGAMKFFEVQDYLTLSDHGYLAYVFMVNEPFFDTLSEEEKTIVREAATEARDYQRSLIADAEAKDLAMFREAGLEILELDADARKAFEQASQPVYDWYRDKFGGETLDMIRQATGRE